MHRRRATSLCWLVVVVCLAPMYGDSRAPAKGGLSAADASARTITIVLSSGATPYRHAESGLRSALHQRGHKTRSALLKDLVNEVGLKASDTDAVVAVGTEAAVQLHADLRASALLTYCMVSDAEAAGLTYDRPAWGVSVNVPLASQFALISEALPKARCVGMLYRSDRATSRKLFMAAKGSMPAGWRLEGVAINMHESEAAAIGELLRRNVDVVWTAPDASVYRAATVRSLLLGAMRRGVPVFGFSRAFVRAGALLGVAIDPEEQGRHTAELTDRLLRRGPESEPKASEEGDPAPQRVHDPRFDLAVNLIVAEKLSIRLPETLVKRARYTFGPGAPDASRPR
jgi:ABC-type uncharacterized transport system substrate-binding protein